jgi:hypothetical protein
MKGFNKVILASSVLAITCLLSACGGGSGSGGSNTPSAGGKVTVNLVDVDKK